ncbi:MAG: glycosyltransferase [Candidatus Krumholzibacteria bacterium]|jgi:glycosyltransferase involved in cell wall biosynthesis|nr:glycosyltransferase [Candidatus Krumholzibacteria bacterium]
MTERRKVLLVISSLSPGGAENHLLNLCRYLGSVSCIPAVLTISGKRTPIRNLLEGEGVEVIDFPLDSLAGLLLPWKLASLRRVVARARPDVIHAHLHHGEVVASIASVLTGVPMVATRHSYGLEFGGARKWMARILGHRTSRVIAVSAEAALEAARLGIPEGRIETIPNGVDTERFRPLEPARRRALREAFTMRHFGAPPGRDCTLIGTLGGLKKVKNLPVFIRMIPVLKAGWKDGAPPARFVISGDGPERGELEDLARRLGLEAEIAMPGFVGDPENLLPLLDIFVLPSITEGAPMALLEAMACGLACVASGVGAIPSILGGDGRDGGDPGAAGIVVDSRDPEEFAAAVLRLAAGEPQRPAFGERARSRAVSNFGLPAWGRRTLDVYEKATGLKF